MKRESTKQARIAIAAILKSEPAISLQDLRDETGLDSKTLYAAIQTMERKGLLTRWRMDVPYIDSYGRHRVLSKPAVLKLP